MIKPPVLQKDDDCTEIGRVFHTPLVIKGKTWLPLTELIAWLVLARAAKNRRPERTWRQALGIGALTMPVVLGSEWGHNLAHAAAARLVGKPADAIRIVWGMPLLVYHDINDESVTPGQHIARASGGPLFNLLALLPALYLKQVTRPDTVAHDLAAAAVGGNALLPAVGLLPIPGIDGGPILKWSLVAGGQTREQADQTVRKADGVLAVILAAAGYRCFQERRRLLGGLLASLAATALGVALGLIKEQSD